MDDPDGLGYSHCLQLDRITLNILQRFENVKRKGPVTIELLTAMGVIYFLSGKMEKAADYFKNVVDLDPNNYSVWNRYGSILQLLKKHSLSRDAYMRALELKPNYITAWLNLARTFHLAVRDHIQNFFLFNFFN